MQKHGRTHTRTHAQAHKDGYTHNRKGYHGMENVCDDNPNIVQLRLDAYVSFSVTQYMRLFDCVR